MSVWKTEDTGALSQLLFFIFPSFFFHFWFIVEKKAEGLFRVEEIVRKGGATHLQFKAEQILHYSPPAPNLPYTLHHSFETSLSAQEEDFAESYGQAVWMETLLQT